MGALSRFRVLFLCAISLTAEAQVPEDVRRKLLAIGFGDHFNTGDELLGREILDFVEDGAARQREHARAR
jgi:hypothetical protein